MARSAEEIIAPVGAVCWLALGLVQMAAEFAELRDWLRLGWFLALVVSVFTGWMPVVGTILGFWGATKVWGWSWYAAVGLFGAPLILFCLFVAGGLLGSLMLRFRARRSL